MEEVRTDRQAMTESNAKGFLVTLSVMVGFTYFSPSMTAGGTLGLGLTFPKFLMAIMLGNLFLAVYTGVLAHIGQKTGETLDELAQHAFGKKGALLASVLIGFTQLGWFGVGVAMFARPVSELFHINSYLLVLIVGSLMTVTAVYGIKALSFFGTVAVPLITILGFYSMYLSINEAGSISAVMNSTSTSTLTLTSALSIVIGSFISGGTATPNFTRFARTNKIAVWSTVIAFFLGNTLMFMFGAVGASVFGKPDIFDVLILQGLAIPAVLSLGLNIWSTNNNALYTSGLSLANVTHATRTAMTIASGTIGTLLAIYLNNHFVGYLNILSAMIPPVGGVIVMHYLKHRKQGVQTAITAWNVRAVIAAVAGIVVGLVVPAGVPSVNALLVSMIIEGLWD
ncbi:MAG: cytosine permease [Aerococcus sp.]|nr:cytosine permease [Aerococcus sp.]